MKPVRSALAQGTTAFRRHHAGAVPVRREWGLLVALAVPSVFLVLWFGGKGVESRAIAMGLCVLAATWAALRSSPVKSRAVWPLWWWCLPVVAITLIQVLPGSEKLLGHPSWSSADTGVLGSPSQVDRTSQDALGGWGSALWMVTLTLLGSAVAWTCHREPRLGRRLLYAVLVVGAVHALLALVMAPFSPGWPNVDYGGRVRGSFVSPNQAVAYWSLLLPSAMLLWARYGSPWGWICGSLALAVVCSASRGGIISAGIVCMPLGLALLPRSVRWRSAAVITIVLLVIAYLINIAPVQERFRQLADEHELSFSGRTEIWKAAWPVVVQAGPWGTGAGTTMQVWRRSGNTTFEPVPVGHLHCDPLELLLEYGWAGCLVVGAGVVVGVILLMRLAPPGRWRRTAVLGPFLGLLITALHGCGDFLISNEAVMASAVTLLAIALTTWQSDEQVEGVQRPVAGGHRAWGLVLAGVLVLGCLPWELRRDRDEHQFTALARALTSGEHSDEQQRLVGAALASEAPATGNARLLALRAHVALLAAGTEEEPAAADHRRQAAQDLELAARISPGEPRAWLARADLALQSHPPDGAMAARCLQRALAWAPAWMVGDAEIWRLLSGPHVSAIPGQERQAIEALVVGADLPQPPQAFAVMERDGGIRALETCVLRPGHARTLASAAAYLRVHGSLAAWLAARLATVGPGATAILVEPSQALAAQAAVTASPNGTQAPPAPAREWSVHLADSASGRQQQAAQLQEAGLPIPAALRKALHQDGDPWALWAETIDPFAPETTDRLRHLGDSDLAWAAAWTTRAEKAARILGGESAILDADADPLLVAGAMAAIDSGRIHESRSGERDRLQLLLGHLRRPQWSEIPEVHWAWIMEDPRTPPIMLVSSGWIGIAIDGHWLEWARGTLDLRQVLTHGLHRVAIIDW